MSPTKESEKKTLQSNSISNAELNFDSIDQFASWLDSELELLVGQFKDFETDKSVRKFFKRS